MAYVNSFVGEFVWYRKKMGIRIPLTSDLDLNLKFTHQKLLYKVLYTISCILSSALFKLRYIILKKIKYFQFLNDY